MNWLTLKLRLPPKVPSWLSVWQKLQEVVAKSIAPLTGSPATVGLPELLELEDELDDELELELELEEELVELEDELEELELEEELDEPLDVLGAPPDEPASCSPPHAISNDATTNSVRDLCIALLHSLLKLISFFSAPRALLLELIFISKIFFLYPAKFFNSDVILL